MISSILLPRVSGMTLHAQKEKNASNMMLGRKHKPCRLSAIVWNVIVTMKFAIQLAVAAVDTPKDEYSGWNSSHGKSHGSGPIPIPKLITKPTVDKIIKMGS
mmetsp:Transcript_79774/g.138423  ORF Transcript_79774/g.138423 Transcript_79774/m.138423 type:complete len:102 (-) Transcript_79774:1113-1418(-)